MPRATLLALAALLAAAGPAAADPAPRPPQFVLLAFDGSLNLDMWRETLEFARGADLRFTYFVSGVYFLLDAQRHRYLEPTHGAGHSAIGFGGEKGEEVVERVAWVNRAHDAGHEIASHVNGHYDGSAWTLPEWQSELDQFPRLLFGVRENNGLAEALPAAPFAFAPASIRGFRAPLLGQNAAMYQALAERGYAYDTSRTSAVGYWPERERGLWNFPLAELRIAGTGKRTLSMDYNFYFAQSEGKPDPAHAAAYRDEMVRTYLAYFAASYLGNRAPVHVGHHFSKWNGGAYWEAMKEFASAVCHLPEVRCVTYRELQAWLEAQPAEALAAWRRGAFDRSEVPEAREALARAEAGIEADLVVGGTPRGTVVTAAVTGPEAHKVRKARGAVTTFAIDGVTVARGPAATVDLRRHRARVVEGSRLTVTVEHRGKQLLKATHAIRKTARGFQLSETPEEARALTGMHPEAHTQEQAHHP